MKALHCHPETPAPAVRVEAAVSRVPGGLKASYRWSGDLAALRIPAPRPARFAEGLWRRGCCELFVAPEGKAGYHEFNFSPSGEWAAFAFRGYRERSPLRLAAPQVEVRREPSGLELDAQVAMPPGAARIGLCAVLEALDGSLSYWALEHAPGRPDFHHARAFAWRLA